MRIRLLACLTFSMWVSGCSGTLNPFVDDSVRVADTPSARKLREAQVESAQRSRGWPESRLAGVSGEVVHWPTWQEDPFEDKGSDDGQFAWTAEDYLAHPYSFVRWLLNTFMLPVSMAVTPPGTPMVSDGELSRQALGSDHDAARVSDVGTRADDAPRQRIEN